MQKSAGEFSETSTLSILTSGLLGEQYIGLAPGFSDEEMGTSMLKDGDMIEDTKSAIVLEDLIGKFLYSQSSPGQHTRNQGVTMFKKIALMLGLMTSMLFSLVARRMSILRTLCPRGSGRPADLCPPESRSGPGEEQPDHLRVIIREELLPYVDNRFAAYKVLGNQIKQTTPAQRDAFVDVFTEYMVSSYADALAHFDKQTVKVQPGKAAESNITAVNVSVKEAGKPDIFLEFKLRKNNKTGEWKAFDMVAEGISLLSAKAERAGRPHPPERHRCGDRPAA